MIFNSNFPFRSHRAQGQTLGVNQDFHSSDFTLTTPSSMQPATTTLSAASPSDPEPAEPNVLHSVRLQDDLAQEDDFSEKEAAETAFTEAEKFELLSAYLDNEVSEQERCLVEQWLLCDLPLQRHYQAQLKLWRAVRSLTFDLFPWATSSLSEPAPEPAPETAAPESSPPDDLSKFSLNVPPLQRFRSDRLALPLADGAIANLSCQSTRQSTRQSIWQNKLWVAFKLGITLSIALSIALEIALGATVANLPIRLTTDRLRPANLR